MHFHIDILYHHLSIHPYKYTTTNFNMSATNQIPTFETLYKRSNTADSKITEWQVWIEPTGSAYNVLCEYGFQDCKKTQHCTTVTKGKAKRTVLEQAILEAKSKWNEKHDREGYRPSIEAMETSAPLRPMLAHTYVPNAKTTGRAYKMPFPCFVQPKLDGIRCIAHIDASGKVVLESRKGTEFVYLDHIRESIKDLFDQWTEDRPARLHLDGELYTDQLTFETISGLVRQKKETRKNMEQDLQLMQKIQYHVYDLYDPANPGMDFADRFKMLCKISPHSRTRGSQIVTVETDYAASQKDLKEKHDKYVAAGYEGIMLRDPIGPYESNKRSKFLQKYKEFMEDEFRIVGYHDGEGIDEGLVIWECALNTNPAHTFSVKPRGTHEYRRQLFEDAEQYVGQLLTVIFQEYSADGVPRFPVGKSVRTDI